MKGVSMVTAIAWLLYTASWFIQCYRGGATLSQGHLPGWDALRVALSSDGDGSFVIQNVISKASALTNLLMIASPLIILGRSARFKGALPWMFTLATILNAVVPIPARERPRGS